MLIARVSNLGAFKRWREDEESGIDALVAMLKGESSEAMRKGTAFHKALEIACESENYFIHSDGYTFHFTGEMEISLPAIREIRWGKDYGGIVVSGQADGILGNTIIDYKTTEYFDAEKYLTGVQHQFYMDIFGLYCFRWYVFEMKEMDEAGHYCVHAMHTLEQYRYPEMEAECRDLALEFKAFADKWLPGFPYHSLTPPPQPPKPTVKEQLQASVDLASIWPMKATKGRNLIAVGWKDGTLRCAFSATDGARFYTYSGVPEAEYHKLIRSPFPDALFASNIKGRYEAVKEAA